MVGTCLYKEIVTCEVETPEGRPLLITVKNEVEIESFMSLLKSPKFLPAEAAKVSKFRDIK